GKIIGAIIGFVIANIPGALIGLLFGHLFDRGAFKNFFQAFGIHSGAQSQTRQLFFNCTFAVMGYIAKSDGHVSEKEIQAARHVMQQMGLQGDAKKQAIKQFYFGKSNEFNLSHVMYDLKQTCRHRPMLLKSFLDIQNAIAQADGHMTPQKQAVLQQIRDELGIPSFNFHGFQGFYQQAGGSRQQQYQRYQRPQYSTQSQLSEAYEMLEIKSSATDAEVKKAYRRMMSKNHPDKLIAEGLPPEMIKIATQKTQQIKDAYELIKQSRGI
ncbi:MAG: co-chaperone DjlA, partial [Gammaproteobacteria bacterium]|nr:co-chaperone DjlA [Gammaproteobacteria bacterium]